MHMLVECIDTLAEASIGTRNGKNELERDNGILKSGRDEIKWSSSITFGGHSSGSTEHHPKALQYGTGQATKMIAMWAPLIFSKWLPLDERMKAFKTAIGWERGTRRMLQASKLKSWAAHTAARVRGIQRAPGNDTGTLWRYLHREGHRLLERFDADPVSEHRLHTDWVDTLQGWQIQPSRKLQ